VAASREPDLRRHGSGGPSRGKREEEGRMSGTKRGGGAPAATAADSRFLYCSMPPTGKVPFDWEVQERAATAAVREQAETVADGSKCRSRRHPCSVPLQVRPVREPAKAAGGGRWGRRLKEGEENRVCWVSRGLVWGWGQYIFTDRPTDRLDQLRRRSDGPKVTW
jgi:hypothetical protein